MGERGRLAGLIGLAFVLGLVSAGCSEAPAYLSEPAKRGRQVYRRHCTACHQANPHAEGLLGPSVAGSSLALLRAKVLGAPAPKGYTPKDRTNSMAAPLQLKPHLESCE